VVSSGSSMLASNVSMTPAYSDMPQVIAILPYDFGEDLATTCSPLLYGSIADDPTASYGDWIITYMDRVRHVDRATAATASSIFWFGMVTGRVVLSPLTEYVGLRTSVTAYILLSIVAQASFKFISRVYLSLGMLAATGFFFGPFFPSGIVLLGSKLPVNAHVGAVSAAAAMGQIGGATAPLIVGFMADAFGIARLPDVVTVLTLLLLVVWIVFCRSR
jgi:fucose permease